MNIFIIIMVSLLYPVSIVVEPYLQNATPTSMTILWETDSASESIVEWGLSIFLTESTYGNSFANYGNSRIHTVELSDLLPDTRYYYRVVVGNHESIVDGQEKKIVRFDSISSYAQSKFENISNDMVVTASNGDIILGAPAGTTLISGGNILLDAANTLVLQAGQIIRSDDAASDVVKGSYKLDAQGEYSLNAGKLTLGSMGATNISSFGAMSQTIGGSSEEVISNLDVLIGNTNAKLIKALLGKIVLETFDGVLTGGIDLNVGPMGAMGQISIKAPLGDIDIKSNTGPTGINIQATTIAKLKGMVQAAVEGALVNIKADALCQIDGSLVTVGGQSEPMILGKTFLMDIFKDHQHPSSVGPTGPIMPQYAAKILQAMSKKCFLG